MEEIKRRSVRTYDGVMLSPGDRGKLDAFISGLSNPFGIPVEFRFLRADEFGLKSPVLSGEKLYLAAKTKRVPHFEEAVGYELEAVVLYACSIGIGTVWIGGTMNRDNFEKAMEVTPDEVMPCVTPVGYPAKKMSLRETMMRKGVKADWRYSLNELVFDKDLAPYALQAGSALEAALESARWAPSAVNKQPWRFIVDGNTVHFYEKPDKGYVSDGTGDMQRIDIGIAMYHFVHIMEKNGVSTSFSVADPSLAVPEDWQYVATYTYGK